ncbi:MAG TPA: SDR family oxidoreductase [Ktedonobacteraceae bacterium]|nr:SDR family oxidoreductase [Ktedonobacteraceae bacterium]
MTVQTRVALVTGASRGIGASVARELATHGIGVIVNYHQNKQAAEAVVNEIAAQGGEALMVQADVQDEVQVEHLVATTLQTYGRIDILVSNASIAHRPASFEEMSWSEFIHKVDGELHAAFALTKAVVPTMKQQQYGRIVYISSEHSIGPAAPGMIANGTAKAALNNFARYIAAEFGPAGITANIVAPGMVETDTSKWVPEVVRQRVLAGTPLQRIAQPEDIARVVAFFASEDSGFMSGTYVPVSGGFGLAPLLNYTKW